MFTLYTRKDCRFCDAAKIVLKGDNLQFTEMVIDKDITREEVQQLYPGASLLPIVVYDGAYIGSYNDLLDFANQLRGNTQCQTTNRTNAT